MTKKELKEIINECIDERFNSIDSITEDTELEIVNESLPIVDLIKDAIAWFK